MKHGCSICGDGEYNTSELLLETLSYSYDGTDESFALQGVEFSIASGDIVSLLGRNGAGKTTLVRCLSGLLHPQTGSIRVSGSNLNGIDAARRFISVASQDLAIYPGNTVTQNLEFFARLSGFNATRRKEQIERVAALLGISKLLPKQVGDLSGGQKRMLHNAIAILEDRPFLIFDEPSAGLDVDSRKLLLGAVKQLARRGKGILYCTHYLPEVEVLGSRVVLLRNGKVVLDDRVEELISDEHTTFEIEFENTRVCSEIAATISGDIELSGSSLQIYGADSTTMLSECIENARSSRKNIVAINSRRGDIESIFRKFTSGASEDQ